MAYGIQFPTRGALKASDFRGGDVSVKRRLEAMGFTVVEPGQVSADSRNRFLLKLNAEGFPDGSSEPADASAWENQVFIVGRTRRSHNGIAIRPRPADLAQGDHVAIWANEPSDRAGLVAIARVAWVSPDVAQCRIEAVTLTPLLRLRDLQANQQDTIARLAADIDEDRPSKVRPLDEPTWASLIGLADIASADTAEIAHLPIAVVAAGIDARASGYAIGQLQTIRATLHRKRRTGTRLFAARTIHERWAFHDGGRTELQFNIGLEDDEQGPLVRFGVAFSLEPSRTYPDLAPLFRKVRFFNEYLSSYPHAFADMSMWSWNGEDRGSDIAPRPIEPEEAQMGRFIFLGLSDPIPALDFDKILRTFDRLLPLYRFVESGGEAPLVETDERQPFAFGAGHRPRARSARVSVAARELVAELRHVEIQDALRRELIREYGTSNVDIEVPTGNGTLIDVVVRRGKRYWFFEIKTSSSPRACLREALGQLLEYSLWPGGQEAERLVVVGETQLDPDGAQYLRALRKRFHLPIDYRRVVRLGR
ncbi:MAG: hypothetical protein JOZ13_08145 [Alphaproteobacteria bacterium]|nr:hypothetical protein [Alphaproteobacteria bacterium]